MNFQERGDTLRPEGRKSGTNAGVLSPSPDIGRTEPPLLTGRIADEQQWLRSLPGMPPGVAASLSARNARLLRVLRGADAAPIETHTTAVEGLADGLLNNLLLPLELLLASGGDDRLTLDPATRLNRYGCAPWPRPEVIAFGSCTASSPSAPAFAAAEHRRRLLVEQALASSNIEQALASSNVEQALASATGVTEDAVLDYFGVADLASAILTASGTDAALAVTGLLMAEQPGAALTSVLVSPAETGSGVPLAVQARHFAPLSPDGHKVAKSEPVEGLGAPPALRVVALREADGRPRSQADIVRSCEAEIAGALRQGRVVLHAIDGSKTGLTAPDRPTLLRLVKRFGDRLDVVVDACQARIEPALVRWYLQHGFAVLVTGSKFFGAPGFCGAVLFPRARLARIADRGRLPDGVCAYLRPGSGPASRLCPGLLLRWEAALHEMRAVARLSPERIGHRLDALGSAVCQAIGRDPRLQLVAAPRPAGMGWSDRRSVFTFLVQGRERPLGMAELRPLYLDLQDTEAGDWRAGHATSPLGVNCQIGQPVELGSPALGGLRIALSAAQVAGGDDLQAELQCTIDKLGLLLDRAGLSRPAAPTGGAALVGSVSV